MVAREAVFQGHKVPKPFSAGALSQTPLGA